MTTTPLHLAAPAKLTASLRVTGVRPDGYHLIDAEMVSLSLADELILWPATDAGVGSTLEVLDELPGENGDRPSLASVAGAGADNLVLRALAMVGRDARVVLTKRIAPGAGLGGGSADAAAILRWAGMMDPEQAARLGADVPFCLRGGRARVRGIGEQLDFLPFACRTYTLVTPPFGCSTPAVYAAWDELGGPTADGPNDLEPAALRIEPRLARFRDELGDATGVQPRLAGSGSTWFIEGAYPGRGRVVVHTTEAIET